MDERQALAGLGRLAGDEQVRLMTKVAHMYHVRRMLQSDIARELHISQPRVSRLLKRAGELGIVRTTVVVPSGVHTALEESLESAYGLDEVVVVDLDADVDDAHLVSALGSAAAGYLETTLLGGDTVGISSWSATLLATVEAMRPSRVPVVDEVVQLVGGVGEQRVQMQATRLLARLASSTGAEPVFMPAPGLLGTASARDSLVADPTVADVLRLWPRLTTVLLGIGSLEPSPLLLSSGNALPEKDQEALRRAGAVGDICQRFFDAAGARVTTDVDARVVGITADELRRVPRRIGVAGGLRKHGALRGALLGGWLTVLVTDVQSAQRLLDDAQAPT